MIVLTQVPSFLDNIFVDVFDYCFVNAFYNYFGNVH